MNLNFYFPSQILIVPKKTNAPKPRTRVLSPERKYVLKYPEVRKCKKEDFTQLFKENFLFKFSFSKAIDKVPRLHNPGVTDH